MGRPAVRLVEDAAGRPAAVRPSGRGRQPGHRALGVRGSARLCQEARPGRQTDHRASARGHEPGRDEDAVRGGPCPAVEVVLVVQRPSTSTTPRCGMLVKAFVDHDRRELRQHHLPASWAATAPPTTTFPSASTCSDVYCFLHGFATTEMALLNGAPTLGQACARRRHCQSSKENGMAEETFVNCTGGGPIRVHVEDGKITRVRPLVFDETDAPPGPSTWTARSTRRSARPA